MLSLIGLVVLVILAGLLTPLLPISERYRNLLYIIVVVVVIAALVYLFFGGGHFGSLRLRG